MGKPITIVDGFAGPGKFGDGSDGSPKLIAEVIRQSGVESRLMAIEAEPQLAAALNKVLGPYQFAEARCAKFLDCIEEIETLAKTHSMFLYLDPFALRGLDFGRLERVFAWVKKRQSVEVLINFNVSAFARCARQAFSAWVRELEGNDDPVPPGITRADLDLIAGGDWWRPIAGADNFVQEVSEYIEGYGTRLSAYFAEVCWHRIQEQAMDSIPKYALLFGSRHPDALLLMNDEMVRSRETLIAESAPAEPALFELRPEALVPDRGKLRPVIVHSLDRPMTRKELVVRVVRAAFGKFETKDVKREISAAIDASEIASATGKSRINDDVQLRRLV